jgi:hypothetical protein
MTKRTNGIWKTVFFNSRYENNKGEAGAWGTMLSAVIP